jgi:hypothetical protein
MLDPLSRYGDCTVKVEARVLVTAPIEAADTADWELLLTESLGGWYVVSSERGGGAREMLVHPESIGKLIALGCRVDPVEE